MLNNYKLLTQEHRDNNKYNLLIVKTQYKGAFAKLTDSSGGFFKKVKKIKNTSYMLF